MLMPYLRFEIRELLLTADKNRAENQMWIQVLDALSCKTFFTHVLNAMRCESSCGWCSCNCETDEIEVGDDTEFRAEGCCGSVEYIDD
jgi:hypothetical protein